MFEQCWKQAPLEGIWLAFGHVLQDARFQHVDTGIDRVARDLVRSGLFNKSLNPAIRTCFHKTVCRRILHRCQDNRRNSTFLSMVRDNGGEIYICKDITVEHDGGSIDVFFGVLKCASGAKRGTFDSVPDPNAIVGTIF